MTASNLSSFVEANALAMVVSLVVSFTTHVNTKFRISMASAADISVCVGIEAYGIYAGVGLMTPHNNIKKQGRNIYLRKSATLILACLLMYLANIVRSVVTLYFYYTGVPFSPLHENIGYITTFFAVFNFYVISYFWLPEFSLFVIWMKERIKGKISEMRSEKEELDKDSIRVKQKEVRKIFLLFFWICVGLILSIIMVYIIFF